MPTLLDVPKDLFLQDQSIDSPDHVQKVLEDFWICCVSREMSLLGRKEVLSGKAKFGILGDGKEVPQVALARAFKKGDFRSGYYRDQTLMMALGLLTVKEFFAQIYADPHHDPHSGGRQMNSHFATPLIDEKGNWTAHTERYNVSADISCTAGQMGRALGLSFASKLYRHNDELPDQSFSQGGNEVCHVTIGDASTSEGPFWETLNAAAVKGAPMSVSVWDDGYGISVPREYQTIKGSISRALEGFLREDGTNGIDMYVVPAWDYPRLVETYARGVKKVREDHVPALFHITEATQPQGHSTSGSHERYKSADRLAWESEMDCNKKMAEWMINVGIATADQIEEIKERARDYVKEQKNEAWKAYNDPVLQAKKELQGLVKGSSQDGQQIYAEGLKELYQAGLSEYVSLARQVRQRDVARAHSNPGLNDWIDTRMGDGARLYDTKLYSDTDKAAVRVPVVHPEYSESSETLSGFQILNEFFDMKLSEIPELLAFGEDVGQIGDVNQGFAGMQEKYGELRVFDAGIREWSILGGAIGASMRGLRPIAEMQYLDYLVYALAPITDDLATVRYRSNGQQMAPAIIRTRGHRLEGIWHAGSPMGMLLGSVRGIYLLTPRNMVQAAGFYNTMLKSDDPAIIIECLNGYRLREKRPDNLGEYTVPLGSPDILIEGADISLVTYGSCVRVAEEAVRRLEQVGICVELIDVQTLIPFDLEHTISRSLSKTNRLVLLDEDVPGGATAYMQQQVLEVQDGFKYLDAMPCCITAAEHRPPYGSDGDYFSKPNADDVFEKLYEIMHESDPERFPL